MLIMIIALIICWGLFLYYTYRGQKLLEALSPGSISVLPKISIIIAVKDGAKELEVTLRKLTSIDYENLEVIVVNDRSKDLTAEVIKNFQQNSPHLFSVHVTDLPHGWLGKVHALNEGVKLASGDFFLFMDADIRINGSVLKSAVAVCEEKNLDHLGVLPRTLHGDFWLNLMMSTSMLLFTLSAKLWIPVEKRPLKSIKGVGAFNFVRKSAFIKTEGFSWLRMDVADDVALAQLIAMNGGLSHLMKAGPDGPELDWYRNFYQLVLGLEKNIVGGFTNYKLSLVIFMSFASILALYIQMLWPVLLLTFIFTLMVRRYSSYSLSVVFSFPLGIALLGCILLRSSYICFTRGGISWSGTFYPLKDLKAGSRVKLGL